jgi:cytochrome c553
LTQVKHPAAAAGNIKAWETSGTLGPASVMDGDSKMKGVAVLGFALALGCGGAASFAADAEFTRLTTICSTCHGVDGNSTSSAFPKLTGQQAPYLEQQLRAFKDRKRDDPPARAYMFGISSQLTEEMVGRLASHYAALPPMSGKAGDAALVEKGGVIYEEGVPQHGVPACRICHGANAEGKDFYPRLAGQHPEYMLKQLLFFQSGVRGNALIMHAVSDGMTFSDMQAVATYLSSKQ